MTMNIFERAARAKLRFKGYMPSGQLTTEQLFDLPLTQLDMIARNVNKAIKEEGEESFIQEVKTRTQAGNELRLEILKAVIAGKQASAKAAETRAVNATRLRRIDEALAKREDKAFDDMSEEDLLAEREKLTK